MTGPPRGHNRGLGGGELESSPLSPADPELQRPPLNPPSSTRTRSSSSPHSLLSATRGRVPLSPSLMASYLFRPFRSTPSPAPPPPASPIPAPPEPSVMPPAPLTDLLSAYTSPDQDGTVAVTPKGSRVDQTLTQSVGRRMILGWGLGDLWNAGWFLANKGQSGDPTGPWTRFYEPEGTMRGLCMAKEARDGAHRPRSGRHPAWPRPVNSRSRD